MTPIPLEVKQYMREFLDKELNREANKQGRIVSQGERQKSETFLDSMWVFINQQAMLDASHESGT